MAPSVPYALQRQAKLSCRLASGDVATSIAVGMVMVMVMAMKHKTTMLCDDGFTCRREFCNTRT